MKKVGSKAKATAIAVAKVPQQIGRGILSVPQTISKIANKNKDNEKLDFADKLDFINKEIVEGQGNRRMVRESMAECMKEVSTHLESFLHENPSASYEEWIASLHPDNAEYADGSIDHRFYVEDSDHRILWNECMEAIGRKDGIIQVRAVEPSYNRALR